MYKIENYVLYLRASASCKCCIFVLYFSEMLYLERPLIASRAPKCIKSLGIRRSDRSKNDREFSWETLIRPRNQGSFGTFGTGRLRTLSRVLIGCDFINNHVRRFGTGKVGLRGVAHASARDTHPGHRSDPATHHDFTHVSDRRSRSAGSSRTPLARTRRRPLRVDHPRPTRFREMVGRYPEGQWEDRE